MINMICKKCDSRINAGAKCFHCGYDTGNLASVLETPAKKYRRSPALLAGGSLLIIIGILQVLYMTSLIFGFIPGLRIITVLAHILPNATFMFYFSIPGVHFAILAGITVIAAAADVLVMCAFMLSMKNQAVKAYVGLTVAGAAVRALTSAIFSPWIIFSMLSPFIFKSIILFVIYKIDGKHFAGAKFNEPVSVKRARKRREMEEKANMAG